MKGFETFMESLTNKNFRSNMHGSGVDLVLSCVDNYEARMVVNQVIATTITKYICFIFFFGISINNATEIFYMVNGYLTT